MSCLPYSTKASIRNSAQVGATALRLVVRQAQHSGPAKAGMGRSMRQRSPGSADWPRAGGGRPSWVLATTVMS